MVFNDELANQTLDYIREHPDEWDQGSWDECFAGIALKLKGYELPATNVYLYDPESGEYLGSIRNLAAKELGFEFGYEVGVGELFSYRNSLADLEEKVRQLSASAD